LTCEVTDDMPPTLIGDNERVKQILSNLVGNAIKFTTEGAISIRIYSPDPDHWALDVADSGPGIPREAQAHLFEAFWQGDDSVTPQYGKGVGLGLAIVRQLVNAMHGEIRLQSEMGHGSTFTIVLPLITQSERSLV
jgi:signal transduction histidine kinase